MTEEELRAVAQATGDVMDAELEPIEKRLAECERLLGIERDELHEIALERLASDDDGVLWQALEDRRMSPETLRRMAQRRGYGPS